MCLCIYVSRQAVLLWLCYNEQSCFFYQLDNLNECRTKTQTLLLSLLIKRRNPKFPQTAISPLSALAHTYKIFKKG